MLDEESSWGPAWREYFFVPSWGIRPPHPTPPQHCLSVVKQISLLQSPPFINRPAAGGGIRAAPVFEVFRGGRPQAGTEAEGQKEPEKLSFKVYKQKQK